MQLHQKKHLRLLLKNRLSYQKSGVNQRIMVREFWLTMHVAGRVHEQRSCVLGVGTEGVSPPLGVGTGGLPRNIWEMKG